MKVKYLCELLRSAMLGLRVYLCVDMITAKFVYYMYILY